jgi:hypothetical protein
MRSLIAGATALILAAAAATALALHSPPAAPPQRPHAAAAPPKDAVPGLVWRSGTATLRLTDRPCPSDELAQAVEMEGVTKARAYEVIQKKRRSTGCWAKGSDDDVVTMEPGRELGSIPIAWFQADAGR